MSFRSSQKPEWLFFDIGGTLVDESRQEAHIVREVRKTFVRLGVEYTTERIYGEIVRAAEACRPSPIKEAIRALSKNEAWYAAVLPAARYPDDLEILYSGVPEVLSRLAGRYRLGIIANQSVGAEDRLRRHGIRDFFSVLALSGELGISKPDLRIFQKALDEAGCSPHNAAYIGDRLDNDIRPANRLGFLTVRALQGLARHQTAQTPDDEPADAVTSLPELCGIFG